MTSNPPLKHLPGKQAVRLNNLNCPYCGTSLDNVEWNEDHVVGRNFIPRGKLQGNWNLILRACRKCNDEKGKLEDDLSAISMQPDAFGAYAVHDKHLVEQALRKSRSISSRTKKSVCNSVEEMSFRAEISPSVEFQLNMTAPPQVSEERAYRLARLHISAFFYWMTFDAGNRKGRFWPGGFFPVIASPRSDWGNPLMRGFENTVKLWWTRVWGITAEGFFKVVIRRCPDQICWSWAMEWNQNYRLVGFCGDQAVADSMIGDLEIPKMHLHKDHAGEVIRYREEVPLSGNEDKMFVV